MIMFILAGASFMSTSMAFTGIPQALAAWVGSFNLSPYTLIAVLAAIYIVLGTALDGISMIVLTTAIVIPMIRKAGFDLVWFGIFIVLLVEIAEVTPPVGFNLFVLQTMSGKDCNTSRTPRCRSSVCWCWRSPSSPCFPTSSWWCRAWLFRGRLRGTRGPTLRRGS